ncbi:DUF4190 domain-containing protein [Kitasatospora purpeofusca]|uniref:hypothetical protein n=1 Tax=Kitasatospora purpeofusca TaxID=67352 RepID=UPI002256B5FC|nr:hypothetical protein [Kitasatospora purpeofusca]MCX4690586.1 DUF4190 domain-containing protein [Kitasatospora purpeofusca]
MTVPAPPDSPPPVEDTTGPRSEDTTDTRAAEDTTGNDPWTAPGADRGDVTGSGGAPAFAAGPPSWAPYPMPVSAPRSGLGTAAMVLGIVGSTLSLAVILFWVSWLPALLAVILGAVGLGHVRKGLATNRAAALAGVVLGITGLLVSTGAGVFVVTQVRALNEERNAQEAAARVRAEAAIEAAATRAAQEKERAEAENQRLEAERQRIAAEREKTAADDRARRLSFGQSYTYPDGLRVTMAAPERYVPSTTVFEAPRNARIVQLRITVVNTGSQGVSLEGAGLPLVKDAFGGPVFTLIDGSGRMKILPGSLAPGEEATGVSAYALPAGAADPFSVGIDHGVGAQRKNVVWSGSPA